MTMNFPWFFYPTCFLLELIVLYILSGFVSRRISYGLLRVTRKPMIAIRLTAFLFLPGVIVHEVSHYAMATVLGVRTHGMEFTPQVMGDSVKLGSVSISQTDPIRRFFIGVAPLLAGLCCIFGAYALYFSPYIMIPLAWKIIILLYILFEIGNTMFSSKKDMEGSVVVMLLFLLLLISLYLFFPQTIGLLATLIENNKAALWQGVIFMSVPICVDIILLFLASFRN